MLQHSYADAGFIISRSCDKKAVQKFVDDALNILADLELVSLR